MREKMRIAVIFESSPFDRKGLFNAVHERTRHLVATGECAVDVFCIHARDNALTRRLRHTAKVPYKDAVTIDGIIYKMLWYRFSVLDHLLVWKLHRRPLFFRSFVNRAVQVLEGYDVISAHSFAGALIASEASRRYGMPYYVSWHGSDVHTFPRRNPLVFRQTKALMEGAACNFFVSASLMEMSSYISGSAGKRVLRNGVAEAFVRFPDQERLMLRKRYGVASGKKVVAFVGNLVAVKNVMVLHPLFRAIRAGYDAPLEFWIVGDGKLRDKVVPGMLADGMLEVRIWGNMPSGEMPSLMNCIDLLVLPSLNEGLPLVTAEALRCGADVIGSRAGGIPEVIGIENTVPLGPSFVGDMASLACRLLSGNDAGGAVDENGNNICPEGTGPAMGATYVDAKQKGSGRALPEDMDWDKTAAAELEFVRLLKTDAAK